MAASIWPGKRRILWAWRISVSDDAERVVFLSAAKPADARRQTRHVFIRDLMLDAHIGVHKHEKGRRQRVRINIDLTVLEKGPDAGDDLANVVCYEDIVDKVKALVEESHINLAETMAERIAGRCLEDLLVMAARIRVEKLTVIAEAASVGVEIERRKAEFFEA
ncbi:MAG TPA: dihydroneopterin aldolase [Alphaproteobacteria bacterium]|jgi:7,8-dihydroneopterin aldolase/epimerase/oxygenase|nr:dihydroneopterin aldolase [Alphaproteobacteria bacterium]